MSVLMISNIAAHYREEFWRLFISKYDDETIFVSGRSKGGIPSFNWQRLEERGMIFRDCKNVYFKKYLIFQFVPVGLLLRPVRNVIFLGEVQVISSWLLLLFYKARGVKCIVWTHGMYGNESTPLYYLRKLFYNIFDEILVYNRRSRQLLIESGISDKKVHIIYNSFNYEILKQANTNSTLIKDEEFSIIFVGRLTAIKDLKLLIRVIKSLKDKGIFVKLHLIGNGPERPSLIHLVELLELESQVFFHGEILDVNLSAKIIKRCHLGISPGNIGLTIVHLMSLGIPCVTHGSLEYQMPEAELILDGINGSYFKRGDEASLEKEIIRWRRKFLNSDMPCSDLIRYEIDKTYNPNMQVKVLLNILLND